VSRDENGQLKDRLPGKELRERLGIDDIALVLQQNRLHIHLTILIPESYAAEGKKLKKLMKFLNVLSSVHTAANLMTT